MKFYCIAPCNEKNKLTVNVSLDEASECDRDKFREEMQGKMQSVIYRISDLDLEKENDCMIIGRVHQKVKYETGEEKKEIYIIECANTRERLKAKKIYVHMDLEQLTPEQKKLVIEKKCLAAFYGKLTINKREVCRNILVKAETCDTLEGIEEMSFGLWDSELFFRTSSNRVILEGEVLRVTTFDEGEESIKRFVFQFKDKDGVPYKINCFMKTANIEELDIIQDGAYLTLIGSLLTYQDRVKETLYYIYQLRVFAIAV